MSSRPAVGWLIRSVLMLGLLLSLAGATGGAPEPFRDDLRHGG